MADDDHWISVSPKSRKLILRFRVKGFPKQFYLSTGLKDTKRNREKVRERREMILTDITLERFDPSLESYRFNPVKNTKPSLITTELAKKEEFNLLQLWGKYTKYKELLIEETTILNKYAAVERYIKKLPTTDLFQAVAIQKWLLQNTTTLMVYELMHEFNRCCLWALDSGLITSNPFEKLQIKKPKSTKKKYQAFTLEQRDLIIKAYENHRLHFHYAPLIKFLFLTGCRPGEAFALTWGDINQECTRINLNKSRNLFGITKGTKNNKERVFPTGIGSKLNNLLLDIQPENCDRTSLVFRSKTGYRMSGTILYQSWSINNGGLGVVRELADKNKIPYLKPYATRHTFITWAITNGVSPDKVALWVGDTVDTILKFYCHPEIVSSECPDF